MYETFWHPMSPQKFLTPYIMCDKARCTRHIDSLHQQIYFWHPTSHINEMYETFWHPISPPKFRTPCCMCDRARRIDTDRPRHIDTLHQQTHFWHPTSHIQGEMYGTMWHPVSLRTFLTPCIIHAGWNLRMCSDVGLHLWPHLPCRKLSHHQANQQKKTTFCVFWKEPCVSS